MAGWPAGPPRPGRHLVGLETAEAAFWPKLLGLGWWAQEPRSRHVSDDHYVAFVEPASSGYPLPSRRRTSRRWLIGSGSTWTASHGLVRDRPETRTVDKPSGLRPVLETGLARADLPQELQASGLQQFWILVPVAVAAATPGLPMHIRHSP